MSCCEQNNELLQAKQRFAASKSGAEQTKNWSLRLLFWSPKNEQNRNRLIMNKMQNGTRMPVFAPKVG